jgi:hypothetical protein
MKTQEEIEQLAEQYTEENTGDHYVYCGYVEGYQKCQEDNKEKKYTEEDLRQAMIVVLVSNSVNGSKAIDDYINSLNKQD